MALIVKGDQSFFSLLMLLTCLARLLHLSAAADGAGWYQIGAAIPGKANDNIIEVHICKNGTRSVVNHWLGGVLRIYDFQDDGIYVGTFNPNYGKSHAEKNILLTSRQWKIHRIGFHSVIPESSTSRGMESPCFLARTRAQGSIAPQFIQATPTSY